MFDLANGQWRHVVTVACRCQMSDEAQPFNPHPGQPHPPQEWVVSLHMRNEEAGEYHRTELHFRLRKERLSLLIQFESMSMRCPPGSAVGPLCHVVETDLEPRKLLNGINETIPGFVLISRSGSPPENEKAAMLLYNPTCSAYVWSEASFSYLPVPFKPESCAPEQR